MSDPFPLMQKYGQEYADPMTCPMLAGPPMVLTWSPEGLKSVYTADPDTFEPGAAEALAVIVGRGSIFLSAGESHKRQRKLLMPPFHGDRMRAYGALMQSTAQRWAAKLSKGASAPMLPITQGITLDIIIKALFGVDDPQKVNELHDNILGIFEAFSPLIAMFRFFQREFGGFGPWAKFQRRAEALRARMRELMTQKRALAGEDVLCLLLSARDEAGEGMSEAEIMDQLLTFVVAGHETTATSLAWALYELHRRPFALAKLREELKALGDSPAPEVVVKQPYLEAVINETIRMHPPLPIVPRRLTREFTLLGHTLPAGTRVGTALYMAHNREETFPRPLEFRPERFLERSFSPFEFVPWGGGVRRCLGAAFAMYEMKIVLAALLSSAEFTLDEPKPVRSTFRIGTYGPETGVRMTPR